MADDQLVVKSDHNWLQTMIVYAGSIVLYCSIIIFYKGKGKVDFESIVLDLILIIVAIMVILWFWWEGGKTIILSKDGCIVKFVNYKVSVKSSALKFNPIHAKLEKTQKTN